MADRPRWVPRWAARMWAAPISVLLIAISFPIFVSIAREGPIVGITLVEHGAASRERLLAGEPWRLLTAMFVHGGYLPLFWNAFFGLRWMALAEARLGKLRFLALYVGFGIAATGWGLLIHDAVVAGASGAIFGLIGDRFVRWGLELGSFKKFFADPNMRMTVAITAAWLLLGSLGGFDSGAGAGGLATGCAFGLLASRFAPKKTAGAGSSDSGASGA